MSKPKAKGKVKKAWNKLLKALGHRSKAKRPCRKAATSSSGPEPRPKRCRSAQKETET